MKLKKLLTIIFGIFSLILIIGLLIVVAIFDLNWWWFFGTLIGVSIVWITFGLIILFKNIKSKIPETIQIDAKGAIAKEVEDVRNDIHNPDNLVVKSFKVQRHGEDGKEKTPILIMYAYGTELMEERVSIINLNNPDKEPTRLVNPSEEEIKRESALMAENPKGDPTVEFLPFGSQVVKRVVPSSQKGRDEQEKQEGEVKNST